MVSSPHGPGWGVFTGNPKWIVREPAQIGNGFSATGWATLPFCDRVVSVVRKDYRPVWTRSFPLSRQPQTISQHLRRFTLGIRRSEAARIGPWKNGQTPLRRAHRLLRSLE